MAHRPPLLALLFALLTLFALAHAQAGVGGVGVGGAAGVPTLAVTQYPTVINVPKIVTITEAGGVVRVTSTETVFTQTFVSTALESWKFREVRTGQIGLGSLKTAEAPKTTGA